MLFFARLLIYALGGIALLFAMATLTPSREIPTVPITTVTEKTLAPSTVVVAEPEAPEALPASIVEKEAEKIPLQKILPPPVAKTVPLPLVPKTTAIPVPVQEPPSVPKFSFDELNQKTREALVNVLCTSKRGGSFNPISVSGIFVDPRGVILTNAHVAEYFLLKDYLTPDFLECVIRTGEPARNRYKARLLYISPMWVAANAKKINLSEPTGTGENDFALLLVTGTTSASISLPETFPYARINMDDSVLRKPMDVLVAAYPAGLLGGINIQKDLYASSAVVRTGSVYSFDENTADIFSVGGSVVAQQGSSGGAVVNTDGELIGLIVTATTGHTTGERNLNALTMSHLNDSFKRHTGDSFASLFAAEDIRASADSFDEKVAPALKKILEDELAGK